MFWSEKLDEISNGLGQEDGPALGFPSSGSYRAKLFWLLTLPLVVTLILTMVNMRNPLYSGKGWARYCTVVSGAWIFGYSWAMVQASLVVADTLSLPSEVLGMVLLAAGTSAPDLLSAVILAKRGDGGSAVAATIGSSVFGTLVGLGLPWLSASLYYGTDVAITGAGTLLGSMGAAAGLAALLYLLVRVNGYSLSACNGYVLLAGFLVFLAQDVARNPDLQA
jgi:hypothetical protein